VSVGDLARERRGHEGCGIGRCWRAFERRTSVERDRLVAGHRPELLREREAGDQVLGAADLRPRRFEDTRVTHRLPVVGAKAEFGEHDGVPLDQLAGMRVRHECRREGVIDVRESELAHECLAQLEHLWSALPVGDARRQIEAWRSMLRQPVAHDPARSGNPPQRGLTDDRISLDRNRLGEACLGTLEPRHLLRRDEFCRQLELEPLDILERQLPLSASVLEGIDPNRELRAPNIDPRDRDRRPATIEQTECDATEYGVPRGGAGACATPARYSYLGGKTRSTELASGVIAMGARAYVPTLGLFLQTDPEPGADANPYGYANADPINRLDLDGDSAATQALAATLAKILSSASDLAEWSDRGASYGPLNKWLDLLNGTALGTTGKYIAYYLREYADTGKFTKSGIGEELAENTFEEVENAGGACSVTANFTSESTSEQLDTLLSGFEAAETAAAEAEAGVAGAGEDFLDELGSLAEDALSKFGGTGVEEDG
jgi:RHS repeat-associated protein